MTYSAPRDFFGNIKYCMTSEDGLFVAIVLAEGTFNYLVHYDVEEGYVLIQDLNWHLITDKARDKSIHMSFANDQAWAEISTRDKTYYLVRMFATKYTSDESLVSTIVYSRPPKCTFESGYNEIFMHCIEDNHLIQYSISTVVNMEFPASETYY